MKRLGQLIVVFAMVFAMAPLVMAGGGVLGTAIDDTFVSTGETFRTTIVIDTHDTTAATPTGRLGFISIQDRKLGVNAQIQFHVPADFAFSNFGCTTVLPGDINLTRQRFIQKDGPDGNPLVNSRVSVDNWMPGDTAILLFQRLGHTVIFGGPVAGRRLPAITQVLNGPVVDGTGTGVCVNGPEPAGQLLLDAQIDILAAPTK